jgi:hypothetical protein
MYTPLLSPFNCFQFTKPIILPKPIQTNPFKPKTSPNHNPSNTPLLNQVQTPQQRRANEAYAKSESAKRGKPQTEVERIMEKKKAAKLSAAQKSPVSKVWLCKFALSLIQAGARSGLEHWAWERGEGQCILGMAMKRKRRGNETRQRRDGVHTRSGWTIVPFYLLEGRC